MHCGNPLQGKALTTNKAYFYYDLNDDLSKKNIVMHVMTVRYKT